MDVGSLDWVVTLALVAVALNKSCEGPKQLGPLKSSELVKKDVLYFEFFCKGLSSLPGKVLLLV